MPWSKNHARKGGKPYARKGMKKRPSTLDRKYKRIKKAQVTRKKRRVVKAAATRAISAMVPLAQPKSKLLKFESTRCRTYRMSNLYNNTGFTGIGNRDSNITFPADGLTFCLNDIYNPYSEAGPVHDGNAANPDGSLANKPVEHAAGFYEVSRKYGKFRVVGAKLTIAFRRMGGAVPINEHSELADAINPVDIMDGDGTVIASEQSPTSSLGTMFDPTNQDPLIMIATADAPWQANQTHVTALSIDEYADVLQMKARPGLHWRELKAGHGTKMTYTHKFSEKELARGAMTDNSDYRQLNAGLFYQTTDEEQGLPQVGKSAASPMHRREVNIRLKPFDKLSPYRNAMTSGRVLVTSTIEYLVKAYEPRQDYNTKFSGP